MQIEFDEEIGDFPCTQVQFGLIIGVDKRQVRNLRDAGTLVEINGKIALIKSLPRYYQNKFGGSQLVDGEEINERTDDAVLERLNKLEDYRRKKLANEIDQGETVRKPDLIPFLRHWSKQTSREFDSIPPQVESTYQECPDCGTRTKLDGRANERIKDTIVRMKNHLHELHRNMSDAKSSK